MAASVSSGSARSTWMWSSGPASHGQFSGKGWREQVMTRQPALEKRFTVAWPMPRLAPVSSKVRGVMFGMSISYGAEAPSGIEQRLAPRRGRSAPPKFQTVVESKRPGTPKLDDERHDAKARPVGRAGNAADVELGRVERHRLFERVTALERGGLLARPGADLGQPRPGREIGVGFRVLDFFGTAAQTYLARERFPVKNQGRLGTGVEFPPFLAVSIGVENQPAPVETLEQHHPDIGKPVGIDGRHRHRIGIGGLRLRRLLEPSGEQVQRIVCGQEITGR